MNSNDVHRDYIAKLAADFTFTHALKLGASEVEAFGIATELRNKLRLKYDEGQSKHGGQLWRKNVSVHALDEVLDLNVYVLTLVMNQIPKLLRLLEEIQECDSLVSAHMLARNAANLLRIGNEDGEEEEEKEPTERKWS